MSTTEPVQVFTPIGACALLGITRNGFYKRIEKYPLEPDYLINENQPCWTEETLRAWDKTIPSVGAPKNLEKLVK
ncbi:hypothetical protein ACN08Z_08210 [Rothia sp. P7181]|uniref:hypothetical protein n=1 Tax=unclassified Rothia (in: high G+C Gram-positive bacteria) TaxID=2689056 RepID=UPI003AC46BC1